MRSKQRPLLSNSGIDRQDEVDQYKRQLEEAARAKVDTKDVAVTDEVRNFAKQNPEITANLLRSWLKEDE